LFEHPELPVPNFKSKKTKGDTIMNQIMPSAEAIQAAFRQFSDSLSPEMKQRMNGRLERGLEIALSGGVSRYEYPERSGFVRRYKVNSSDLTRLPYQVDLVARSCTCPDYFKGHFCKHRVAAQVFELALAKVQPKEVEPIQSQEVQSIPSPTTQPAQPSVDQANSSEAIIWACVQLDGKTIGVEVLGLEGDLVRVQALPAITEAGKLEPQFPFPSGYCTQLVQANDLFHVNVYRNT
jgi:hypothetical protein